MRRLPERTVAGRIPRRKPHPLLPLRVKRDSEPVPAEGRLVGRRDNLAVGFQAVAPDYLYEFQGERPLQISHDRSLIAGALQAEALEEHLAVRVKEGARPQRANERGAVLVEAGTLRRMYVS